MSWSHVTIAGEVTRAPRLRRTSAGRSVVKFDVCVTYNVTGPDGQQHVIRRSVEAVCFNKLAEHVHDTLRAGTRVIASGVLAIRTWETPRGGNGSSIDLIVTEVGVSLRRPVATAAEIPEVAAS